MTEDIDTLTGPELSEAVASEVMGWEKYSPPYEMIWKTSGYDISECDWQPHTDRNDAHRVLMRCEELGAGVVWKVWAVIRKHSGQPQHHDPFPWEWRLFSIDPAIICRAALRAVRASR